jgi:hypothetical protein
MKDMGCYELTNISQMLPDITFLCIYGRTQSQIYFWCFTETHKPTYPTAFQVVLPL